MLLVVGILNLHFFRWLIARKGLGFACIAVFLQLLHYLTSAIGLLAGTVVAAKIWVIQIFQRDRRSEVDFGD